MENCTPIPGDETDFFEDQVIENQENIPPAVQTRSGRVVRRKTK